MHPQPLLLARNSPVAAHTVWSRTYALSFRTLTHARRSPLARRFLSSVRRRTLTLPRHPTQPLSHPPNPEPATSAQPICVQAFCTSCQLFRSNASGQRFTAPWPPRSSPLRRSGHKCGCTTGARQLLIAGRAAHRSQNALGSSHIRTPRRAVTMRVVADCALRSQQAEKSSRARRLLRKTLIVPASRQCIATRVQGQISTQTSRTSANIPWGCDA